MSQPAGVLTERSSRVVAAAKLHRRVGRKRAGYFLAEGPNLVRAALACRAVRELFVTDAAAQRFGDLLSDVEAPVWHVTDRAGKALSETVTPVGLVAVCELPDVGLDEVLHARPGMVLVAVDVSEPGNAGTLIRLADALGAAAVVLAGHSVDPLNAKCLRASAGSVFGVPVVTAVDTVGALDTLSAAGLQVLATTVDGDVSIDDLDPQLAGPTAWVFGSEAHGLSADVVAHADSTVRIPIAGSAESLNIAAAAAICLYQTSRAQR